MHQPQDLVELRSNVYDFRFLASAVPEREMAGVMHAINRNSNIDTQSVNCPLICKNSISVFRVLPALRLLMPLVDLLNALSVYMASGLFHHPFRIKKQGEKHLRKITRAQ